jgi:hypothetical protein
MAKDRQSTTPAEPPSVDDDNFDLRLELEESAGPAAAPPPPPPPPYVSRTVLLAVKPAERDKRPKPERSVLLGEFTDALRERNLQLGETLLDIVAAKFLFLEAGGPYGKPKGLSALVGALIDDLEKVPPGTAEWVTCLGNKAEGFLGACLTMREDEAAAQAVVDRAAAALTAPPVMADSAPVPSLGVDKGKDQVTDLSEAAFEPHLSDGLEAVLAVLAELQAFEVDAMAPLDPQLEEVTDLFSRVNRLAKAAATKKLNAVLAAARQKKEDRKGEWSCIVLRTVKRCADCGLDARGLDLTQDEVLDALQTKLDSLAGKELQSFEANNEEVALIRPALDKFHLRLLYTDEGGTEHFVSVRCIKPHGSKHGSIQARRSGGDDAPYTGVPWPHLTVCKVK